MLSERQLKIVFDLENARDLITAGYLASKYHVSLRTIRNDIEEIAYSIQPYDIQFIRIPKMGMRIISDGHLVSKLMYDTDITSFTSLSSNQQNYLLAAIFFYFPNPITLDFLAKACFISKSTVTSKLRAMESYLSEFNVSLLAVKHKGFYLQGSNASLTDLFTDICNKVSYAAFNTSILKSFFSQSEIELIGKITSYIANDLLFYPTNHDALTMVLGCVIKDTGLFKDDEVSSLPSDTETIIINPNIANLLLYLNTNLGKELNKGYGLLIRTAIQHYTDATSVLRSSYDESENLEKAVHLMVQEGLKYYPELAEDSHELEKSLMMHLYYTLNRIKANLDNKNPLFEQIIERFGPIFENVKQISTIFTKNYPLVLNDDECSFITLYFINFLEKARHNKPVKALLVCNSGIGATKLLNTKIRNNFPSIEIVDSSSYFDIQSNKRDLSDISLIISTISIPSSVNVPVVIVSPLLDAEDAVKISKYLPNSSTHATGMNIMQNKDQILQLDHNEGYIYSEVTVALYEMLSEIYTDGISNQDFPSLAGLSTHVLMSINRWITHEFIVAPEFDRYKAAYPKEMKSILRFLAKIEKMLKIYIDPVESVALLRYMIQE